MSERAPWSHQTHLAPESSSPTRAREFVAVHLLDHDLAHLVDDVMLVISELATNAVQHARTPYLVVLSGVDGTVALEVADGSALAPTMGDASASGLRGRGLVIVDALSRDWGVTASGAGGKTVWAEFDLAP